MPGEGRGVARAARTDPEVEHAGDARGPAPAAVPLMAATVGIGSAASAVTSGL
jgi:hypothetical protein